MLRAALAWAAPNKTNERKSFLISEPVCAVRAETEDVLQQNLAIGDALARLVLRDLQSEAAELAQAPVDHQGVAARAVVGQLQRQVGDDVGGYRAVVQAIVPVADA